MIKGIGNGCKVRKWHNDLMSLIERWPQCLHGRYPVEHCIKNVSERPSEAANERTNLVDALEDPT